MKCKHAVIYFSKGKPVAYSLLVEGSKQNLTVPSGLRAVKTTFTRAYLRFSCIRSKWNPDGTPSADGNNGTRLGPTPKVKG